MMEVTLTHSSSWIDSIITNWSQSALRLMRSVRIDEHLGMPPDYYMKLKSNPPMYVIGCDEVGRGSLAGPVTVGAFLAPLAWAMGGVNDSKRLTASKREDISCEILRDATTANFICSTDNKIVDKFGIDKACQLALENCLELMLEEYPAEFDSSFIVTDGGLRARHVAHACFPKADGVSVHVAAASILAKVSRDAWMRDEAHRLYAHYDFASNAGYNSPKHQVGLRVNGLCPLHRRTFLRKPPGVDDEGLA